MPLVSWLAFLFGAALGSFLNVVIMRYPRQPVTGRSACPHCQKQLTWWELIPIISFLYLKGRCRTCQQNLTLQYPLVELACALAFLILFNPPLSAWTDFTSRALAGLAIALLIILFVIDLKTLFLPDRFIAMLTGTVALQLAVTLGPLYRSALGTVIGSGFILSLWLITSGRGIGLGDVKLMVPLGALFGPVDTLLLLMLSFIGGGLIALFLLTSGRATMKTAVPFGPYLASTAALFILFPSLPQLLLDWIV